MRNLMPVRYILRTQKEERELRLPPEGWDDDRLMWKFNIKRFGYERAVSDTYRFFKDDANFLRRIYGQGGIQAYCELIVERLNEHNRTYFEVFRAEIDFSTFIDEKDFIETGATEQGFKGDVEINGDKNYDVAINQTPYHNVSMEKGMILAENMTYKIRRSHDTGSIVMRGSGNESFIITKGIDFNTFDNILNDGNFWFLRTGKEADIGSSEIIVSINFSSRLVDDTGGAGRKDITIAIDECLDSAGRQRVRRIPLYTKNNTSEDEFISFQAEFNIIPERFYALVFYDPNNSSLQYPPKGVKPGEMSSVGFSFMGTSRTSTFYFKAVKAKDWLKVLLDKCSDKNPTITSDVLDAVSDNLFVTCADALRMIDAPIAKTSYWDFAESISALFCTGSQISGNSYNLTKKENIWNKDKELVDLGNVTRLKFEDGKDYVFSSIKVGMENKDYDFNQGRLEFGTTLEFGTPITKWREQLEIITKYRIDPTGFHLVNYKLAKSAEKDSSSDNDMWFVWCKKKGGNYIVDQDVINMQNGVDGWFNFRLSPKRMLMNHAGFIASFLDKTNKMLVYNSSDKPESRLISQVAGEQTRIPEKESRSVYNYPTHYKPIIVEFKANLDGQLIEKFKNGIYGYMSFTFNKQKLKCYPLDVTEGLGMGRPQSIRAIMHSDTPDDFLVKVREKDWRQ